MKNKFDYQALGKRIRSLRKQRHLTQEQLAEACDLSTAHIGHIERGTRALSIESLITIASVLETSTDYLLLDVSNNTEKHLSGVFNAINSYNNSNFDKFYSVVKILAENIDKL